MPPQVIEENGIRFEVVNDGDAGDPLREVDAGTSTLEPGATKPEVLTSTIENDDEDEGAESTPTSEEDDSEDEDSSDLEARLDTFIEQRATARAQEQVKSVQSVKDKQIAALERQNSALAESMKGLRDEVRQVKLTGLSDLDKSRLQEEWDFEDRKTTLNDYEVELEGFYKDLMLKALVIDYQQFGVTEGQLSQMETPEEMEQVCKDAELAYWREQARNPKTATAANATAAAPKAQAKAPAGARAPSDLPGGGGNVLPDSQRGKPVEGTGIKALAETFNNLPFANVRL